MFCLDISFRFTEVDKDNIQRQRESDNGSDMIFVLMNRYQEKHFPVETKQKQTMDWNRLSSQESWAPGSKCIKSSRESETGETGVQDSLQQVYLKGKKKKKDFSGSANKYQRFLRDGRQSPPTGRTPTFILLIRDTIFPVQLSSVFFPQTQNSPWSWFQNRNRVDVSKRQLIITVV